jgi:Chaperone of endosialidase
MSIISSSTTSTTAYKVTADTTGTLVLQTGASPTTAVTIDGSQNVGIGGTSSSSGITVGKQYGGINITGGGGTYAQWGGGYGLFPLAGVGLGVASQVSIAFLVNNTSTQAMTLDSSGNLLVGTTSASPSDSNSFLYNVSGKAAVLNHATGTGSGQQYIGFTYAGTYIGSIAQNGTTGVLYNLTSDYRLKNDQQPLTGAKEFVMALQPKKWQWWDGSGEGVGFIAHEFMEVAKYSGHGEKDAVDENGNIVAQSIQPSSSEVMANLVAFIQELKAELDAAKADIATLKGAA